MSNPSIDPNDADLSSEETRLISVAELLARHQEQGSPTESRSYPGTGQFHLDRDTAVLPSPSSRSSLASQDLSRALEEQSCDHPDQCEQTNNDHLIESYDARVDTYHETTGEEKREDAPPPMLPARIDTGCSVIDSHAERMSPDHFDEDNLEKHVSLSALEEYHLVRAHQDHCPPAQGHHETDHDAYRDIPSSSNDKQQCSQRDQSQNSLENISKNSSKNVSHKGAPHKSRWREGLILIAQTICMVALGGGLWIGFTFLWQWNSIVALLLTVMVTLSFVALVQLARRTADSISTLLAVGLGLLLTLGPLVMQSR